MPWLIGSIIAGLAQFFASRAGMILAGFGLTLVSYKGFQAFLGYAITEIQTIASYVSAGGGSSIGLGAKMLQFAAFAGLFDGVNIMISGYMAYASLMSAKAVFSRLTGA